MKRITIVTLLSLILAFSLLACTAGSAPVSSQDAVNTAVVGTQQSEALAQATVNAVSLTAMPATPTPGPTVEYVTLTEEELTALIDEAVAEAITATEQTSETVYYITEDDAVTYEEIEYLYDYYYYADYYLEYAEELIDQYYYLYADLADEMIAALGGIEQQLAQMNETLYSIDQTAQEINSQLEQGLALAEETINQLEDAAQTAQTHAQELQANAQNLTSTLQLDQQNRMNQISQIQPNNIPEDKISALQTAFSFVDVANQALGDNQLSRDELLTLTQIGKNAQAGFQNVGAINELGLEQFSGKFDEISTQLALGQISQGKINLNQFEASLGNRPDFGGASGGANLPGGGLPGNAPGSSLPSGPRK